MFGSLGVPELLVALFAVVVPGIVIGIPAGIVFRRAGHPQWLGLLALIPVVNIGLLWFLATAPWGPVETAPPSPTWLHGLPGTLRRVIATIRGRAADGG